MPDLDKRSARSESEHGSMGGMAVLGVGARHGDDRWHEAQVFLLRFI